MAARTCPVPGCTLPPGLAWLTPFCPGHDRRVRALRDHGTAHPIHVVASVDRAELTADEVELFGLAS